MHVLTLTFLDIKGRFQHEYVLTFSGCYHHYHLMIPDMSHDYPVTAAAHVVSVLA